MKLNVTALDNMLDKIRGSRCYRVTSEDGKTVNAEMFLNDVRESGHISKGKPAFHGAGSTKYRTEIIAAVQEYERKVDWQKELDFACKLKERLDAEDSVETANDEWEALINKTRAALLVPELAVITLTGDVVNESHGGILKAGTQGTVLEVFRYGDCLAEFLDKGRTIGIVELKRSQFAVDGGE